MAYITDENGNYKRTVRCGHCYEKGHNKSACPKRKQDLKDNVERYTKELAENKFVHDYQRDNTERYLRHSKDQIHKMETRGQNRKCGYGTQPGHTKRTCSMRKEQVATKSSEAIALRKCAASRMIAAGFGPGALVMVPPPSGGDSVLAVVTHVNFDELRPNAKVTRTSYFDTHRGISFQYVVPVSDRWGGKYEKGSCYMNQDYLNIDDIPESEWYRNPNNAEAQLLSGVEVSEDALLPESAIDAKQVSKWITDNIVDPK